MGKRKRREHDTGPEDSHSSKTSSSRLDIGATRQVQVVTGSYDRILHGIVASISRSGANAVLDAHFHDNFLFRAHSSAIRCLAISPPRYTRGSVKPPKVILASGSTDERINLYHISASAQLEKTNELSLPSVGVNARAKSSQNKELGAILHHSSSISSLCFPSRSKLLSAAEDNTIAISRTSDWTVLSTIKAPFPKTVGRPSGDTAPPGGTPAGVNDFAIHPSKKLMISVGKGEKCMRLWNLVTGKKAGVLNLEKELLQCVGEGKRASGEGRKVRWNSSGSEFAVAFERGVVTFGMVLPSHLSYQPYRY